MADTLAKHGFKSPKELDNKPRLDTEQRYLVTQFMVLHRTRGQGMGGPGPITLEACQAFLAFWPQWDELKFIETILLADQLFLNHIYQAKEKTKATPKQ